MRVELPAPLNPIEWHAPEDVPLLGESDHPYLHFHHDEHICMDHHADFEVAAFPATPLLPSVEEVHDDDFSDFVESPASEVPPEVKTKAVGKEASAGELADFFSFEYIQHVAIILTVQVLIPIPFMIPMGINFMKRALKVFIPGIALGLVGHSVYNVTQSLNAESASLYSIVNSLPSSSSFIPSLFAQLKVGALGGIIIGAGMAHVLNLTILGHTLCRLVRRLEPEPTLMRRAMDSSKTFQRTRRVLLDVITGVGMMPAGVVGRRLCFGLMGKVVAPVDFSLWHSSMIGLVGALAIQLLVLSRPKSASKSASAVKSPVKS